MELRREDFFPPLAAQSACCVSSKLPNVNCAKIKCQKVYFLKTCFYFAKYSIKKGEKKMRKLLSSFGIALLMVMVFFPVKSNAAGKIRIKC